jgi:hypothetical protein
MIMGKVLGIEAEDLHGSLQSLQENSGKVNQIRSESPLFMSFQKYHVLVI